MFSSVWWLLLAAWWLHEGACEPKLEVNSVQGPCRLARLHVEGRNHEQGNWTAIVGDVQGVIAHHSAGGRSEGSESGYWEAAVYYGMHGCEGQEENGKPQVKRTYVFHTKPATWDDAEKICQTKGATLAFPHSKDEANALHDIFSQHHDISDKDVVENQARIGAFSPEADGHFVTLKGESVGASGYTSWAEGQPDNYLQEENCVALLRKGALNDVPCWLELPFICEK